MSLVPFKEKLEFIDKILDTMNQAERTIVANLVFATAYNKLDIDQPLPTGRSIDIQDTVDDTEEHIKMTDTTVRKLISKLDVQLEIYNQ